VVVLLLLFQNPGQPVEPEQSPNMQMDRLTA